MDTREMSDPISIETQDENIGALVLSGEMEASPAAPVLLDSLPYVDAIHEDYEQYAAYLIEQEMQNMKTTSRTIREIPSMKFRSPLLKQEYARVVAHESNQDNDNHNDHGKPVAARPTFEVEIKPPSSDDGDGDGDSNSSSIIEAWEKAVRQAKIAYEMERIRGVMLELEKEGVMAQQWKRWNAVLENSSQTMEAWHQLQRQVVDQINLARQEHQESVARELHVLQTQYQQLIVNLYQLKMAVANLEQELRNMQENTPMPIPQN